MSKERGLLLRVRDDVLIFRPDDTPAKRATREASVRSAIDALLAEPETGERVWRVVEAWEHKPQTVRLYTDEHDAMKRYHRHHPKRTGFGISCARIGKWEAE